MSYRKLTNWNKQSPMSVVNTRPKLHKWIHKTSNSTRITMAAAMHVPRSRFYSRDIKLTSCRAKVTPLTDRIFYTIGRVSVSYETFSRILVHWICPVVYYPTKTNQLFKHMCNLINWSFKKVFYNCYHMKK